MKSTNPVTFVGVAGSPNLCGTIDIRAILCYSVCAVEKNNMASFSFDIHRIFDMERS